MPEFRVIGLELVKRYNLAQQLRDKHVRARIDKLRTIVPRRSTRRLFNEDDPPPKAAASAEKMFKDELIFVERSPNFCQQSARLDTVGTKGRVCKTLTASGSRNGTAEQDADAVAASCDYLCCGRGYAARVVETVEDCDCQFQWCCSVKCKRCVKKVIQYVCS
jgi:hypothetical protein